MKPAETPQTREAVAFARLLAAGDHRGAHAVLSSKLRSTLTPEALKKDYEAMVGYGSGAPTTIEVVTTMNEWPDKQAGDLEWVYVAMANDSYSEAVTLVIAREGPRLVVRSIEWGRP